MKPEIARTPEIAIKHADETGIAVLNDACTVWLFSSHEFHAQKIISSNFCPQTEKEIIAHNYWIKTKSGTFLPVDGPDSVWLKEYLNPKYNQRMV
jgi:hypothetical protein